jgi:RecB family exonuclease
MCPRKWCYEKVERAPKERISSALVFGIAVHDVLARVNEAAIVDEKIDAQAAFTATWTTTIAEASVPIHYGKDDADDLFAKGRALVAAYQPPPGIIGVEQAFSVDLDPDLPPVEGRIDLIRRDDDGNLVLADLKTSGTKVLTDTHAVEAQLGLYDLAFPAVRWEAIVLGKLKTPTITVQSIIAWKPAQVRQHYSEIYHAMAAGVRFANRGWQCEGCSFANRCGKEAA